MDDEPLMRFPETESLHEHHGEASPSNGSFLRNYDLQGSQCSRPEMLTPDGTEPISSPASPIGSPRDSPEDAEKRFQESWELERNGETATILQEEPVSELKVDMEREEKEENEITGFMDDFTEPITPDSVNTEEANERDEEDEPVERSVSNLSDEVEPRSDKADMAGDRYQEPLSIDGNIPSPHFQTPDGEPLLPDEGQSSENSQEEPTVLADTREIENDSFADKTVLGNSQHLDDEEQRVDEESASTPTSVLAVNGTPSTEDAIRHLFASPPPTLEHSANVTAEAEGVIMRLLDDVDSQIKQVKDSGPLVDYDDENSRDVHSVGEPILASLGSDLPQPGDTDQEHASLIEQRPDDSMDETSTSVPLEEQVETVRTFPEGNDPMDPTASENPDEIVIVEKPIKVEPLDSPKQRISEEMNHAQEVWDRDHPMSEEDSPPFFDAILNMAMSGVHEDEPKSSQNSKRSTDADDSSNHSFESTVDVEEAARKTGVSSSPSKEMDEMLKSIGLMKRTTDPSLQNRGDALRTEREQSMEIEPPPPSRRRDSASVSIADSTKTVSSDSGETLGQRLLKNRTARPGRGRTLARRGRGGHPSVSGRKAADRAPLVMRITRKAAQETQHETSKLTCGIKTCQNYRKAIENVFPFPDPATQPGIRRIWLARINKGKEILHPPELKNAHIGVCSVHFASGDLITGPGGLTLRQSSLPSLFPAAAPTSSALAPKKPVHVAPAPVVVQTKAQFARKTVGSSGLPKPVEQPSLVSKLVLKPALVAAKPPLVASSSCCDCKARGCKLKHTQIPTSMPPALPAAAAATLKANTAKSAPVVKDDLKRKRGDFVGRNLSEAEGDDIQQDEPIAKKTKISVTTKLKDPVQIRPLLLKPVVATSSVASRPPIKVNIQKPMVSAPKPPPMISLPKPVIRVQLAPAPVVAPIAPIYLPPPPVPKVVTATKTVQVDKDELDPDDSEDEVQDVIHEAHDEILELRYQLENTELDLMGERKKVTHLEARVAAWIREHFNEVNLQTERVDMMDKLAAYYLDKARKAEDEKKSIKAELELFRANYTRSQKETESYRSQILEIQCASSRQLEQILAAKQKNEKEAGDTIAALRRQLAESVLAAENTKSAAAAARREQEATDQTKASLLSQAYVRAPVPVTTPATVPRTRKKRTSAAEQPDNVPSSSSGPVTAPIAPTPTLRKRGRKPKSREEDLPVPSPKKPRESSVDRAVRYLMSL